MLKKLSMNRKNTTFLAYSLMIVGMVLSFDELVMHILPDLSAYHVEPFHHWMLGIVFLILAAFLFCRRR